uniref:Uncharacterized protein n=1 Tax=Ananas comosus var. bracteatus TaxID=296719 RepID=A0A6V7QPG7_ANACO|nr:unnamed protein product [Ananas comosus var. bracteatus]
MAVDFVVLLKLKVLAASDGGSSGHSPLHVALSYFFLLELPLGHGSRLCGDAEAEAPRCEQQRRRPLSSPCCSLVVLLTQASSRRSNEGFLCRYGVCDEALLFRLNRVLFADARDGRRWRRALRLFHDRAIGRAGTNMQSNEDSLHAFSMLAL